MNRKMLEAMTNMTPPPSMGLMESYKGRSYSSTQIALDPAAHAAVLKLGKMIPDRWLAGDGRETDPHITVKYGIHGSNAAGVRRVLAKERPIKYKLGKISKFELDDMDVVKIDIVSPDLHRINGKIKAAVACTDTHPTYKPHATIAYVKKVFNLSMIPAACKGMGGVADTVEFSAKNGGSKFIKIGGR